MPISIRDTLFLRAWSFWKIPLLFTAGPRVIRLDERECVVALPYRRVNLNHLNSMYFGALCIGADVAGGLFAATLLRRLKKGKSSFVFKDFQAKFLKRPEAETWFTCRVGEQIRAAVEQAAATGQRVELPVPVTATVPSKFGEEPVAEFVLTLSMKVQGG